MWKSRYAKNLLVAGFVNVSAVVERIKEIHDDIYILCAGKNTQFCIEDAVAAGMIIKQLMDEMNYYSINGKNYFTLKKWFY